MKLKFALLIIMLSIIAASCHKWEDYEEDLNYYSSDMDIPKSIIIKPNNKILVAGFKKASNESTKTVLVQYNEGGSLDESFGESGVKVIADGGVNYSNEGLPVMIEGDNEYYSISTLLDDNSNLLVLLSGWYNYPHTRPVLYRFNEMGDLDNSFGNSGEINPDSGFFHSVKIYNNSIFLAGTSKRYGDTIDNDFMLVKYQLNGNPDMGMNNGNPVKINFEYLADIGLDMVVQSSQKIVIGGFLNDWYPNEDFALTRIYEDGGIDSTFGSFGKVITDIQDADRVKNIAIQSDDKILVAGYTRIESNHFNHDFLVARYNMHGNLDNTFGMDGIAIIDIYNSSNDNLAKMLLLPDEKIVLVGSTSYKDDSLNTIQNFFSMLRLNTDGSIDGSFGNNGKTITELPEKQIFAESATIQPDGKIIVIGRAIMSETDTADNTDFILIRYYEDGSLDDSFGSKGYVVTHLEI